MKRTKKFKLVDGHFIQRKPKIDTIHVLSILTVLVIVALVYINIQ